jgi:hypothetical protein
MNAIIKNGRAHASDFLPQAKARRAGQTRALMPT